MSSVLEEHCPEVYTVEVRALLDGVPEVISGYSIFHEVEVPEDASPYNPNPPRKGLGDSP